MGSFSKLFCFGFFFFLLSSFSGDHFAGDLSDMTNVSDWNTQQSKRNDRYIYLKLRGLKY